MKTLRAGVIGCGSIFPMHAYPLQALENVEFAAVCDIDRKKADDAAEKFSCKAFYDYKEMIDSGEIDAVHILTPHYLHCEMTLYALQKGLHVISEKPMAILPEEGKAMYDAGKKSGGKMGVIFQNRYNPGSVFAKEIIESGKLGKVLGGKIIVTWHRDASYYASADWRGTWDKEGGGVIINQSIHSFDLARWLIGKEVLSVDAHIENRIHPTIEVEDEACGVVHFEDDVNVIFYATNNFSMDDKIEVMLHFENGIIRILGNKAEITYNDGTVEQSPEDTLKVNFGEGAKTCWGTSHYKQIKDMYRAFYEGGDDFWLEQAYKTFGMITKLYESAKKGE